MTAPADRVWDVGRLVLNVLVFTVALGALLGGLSFRPLAAYFPLTAAGMIALLVAIQMGIDLRNFLRGSPVLVRGMDVDSPLHGMGVTGLLAALRYIGWLFLFLALLYLTGALVSAGLFLGAFLRLEARWTWSGVVVAAVLVVIASVVMIGGLGLVAPRALWQVGYGLL
ncbi:MAG: hypothetical protein GEU81_09245 [Nitriliruptorales bacterium]|nr:hypothetical protein [Nitriliruptorales bacterium]